MFGSLITLAGIVLGLPEATITGAAMVVVFLATVVYVLISVLTTPKVSLQRIIVVPSSTGIAFVGDDVPIDVVLRPARRTPTAELVEIALDDLAVRRGARSVRMAVRPLRAGESTTANYRVALRHRGLLRFLPGEWRRADPLALLSWSRRLDEGGELLVAPAVVDLPDDTIDTLASVRPKAERGREITADPFTLRELRPYVPGDDLRRIHWATSARRNALMMREPERMRTEHESPIHLLVDGRKSAHDNSLELALSIAASIVVAMEGPFVTTVLTDDGSTRTTTVADTLTCLAAVEREPSRAGRNRPNRAPDRTVTLPIDGAHLVVTGPITLSVGRIGDTNVGTTTPAHITARSESSPIVFRSGLAPFDPTQWEPGVATRQALSEAIVLSLAGRHVSGPDMIGARR